GVLVAVATRCLSQRVLRDVRDRFVFFFSSRRRHTRLVSDWSSDVCSSDLAGASAARQPAAPVGDPRRERAAPAGRRSRGHEPARSEERRVGKEWRSRGARWDWKKTRGKSGGRRTGVAQQEAGEWTSEDRRQ